MRKSITALISAFVLTSVFLCSCANESKGEISSFTESESSQNTSISASTSSQDTNTSSEYDWQINTSNSNLRDETSSAFEDTAVRFPPVEKFEEGGIKRENYHGYKELVKNGTNAEIKAYIAFVTAFDKYELSVKFNFDLSLDEMKKAYNYYRDDYPQHFWRGHSYNYSIIGDKVISFTLASPAFDGDKSKIKAAQNVLNNEVGKIIKAIGKKSAVEKERYIHDYLVNSCKYDIEDKGKNSHNMYGAIIEKKAVCEGYANAFLYLCRLANIECYTVKGSFKVLNGMQSHIWNMVKLDDMYYHVDVTADDPIVNGGEVDVLEHTYFNVNDSQIAIDHEIKDNTYNIDKAYGARYNFFKYYGLEISQGTVDAFVDAYAFAARNNYKYAEIKFVNLKHLSKCPDFIMENNNKIIKMANKMLKKEVLGESSQVNYMQNKEHNILSIMLEYK